MQLSVIVGSTTYSLTDGNPYSLESATGLGIAPVQRRMSDYIGAPGAIDYGYALSERIVTLALLFEADSDAQLDGYRNNLQRIFAPGTNAPLVLRVVRDDGEERRLDVVASGLGFLALDATHRPGHLHRCVVQLRAAEPTWYGGAGGTVTFGSQPPFEWYLASGSIDSSAVFSLGDWPNSTSDPVPFSFGTLSPYEVSMASRGQILNSGTDKYIFVMNGTAFGEPSFQLFKPASSGGTLKYSMGTAGPYDMVIPTATIIHLVFSMGSTHIRAFLNGTMAIEAAHGYGLASVRRSGGTILPDIMHVNTFLSRVAVYGGVEVEQDLADILRESMMNDLYVNYNQSGTISAPAGDDWLYPTVRMRGYIADPVLENVTTGRTISMVGATIPSNAVYTLSLAGSAIHMLDSGGTVQTFGLSDDSGIGDFAIQPGTPNVINLTAALHNQNTRGSITYGAARYMGV